MADQRIDKWTRWIDGPIKKSVLQMYLHRDVWSEVGTMLGDNGGLPDSYWWEFMRDTYATTQAMAVRRQADPDPQTASLAQVVVQMRDDPKRITREFWFGLWSDPGDSFTRMSAEQGWTTQFAGDAGDHLDPSIPEADYEALIAAAARVRLWVDKHVAHLDASAVSKQITLTLDEVHEAVDVIGNVFEKYYNLLTASSWAGLVPTLQHDWKAIFRVPWMRANV